MTNFKTLGVMIDVSRNAVMTVDALKRFTKLLKRMGYNTLLLYMEDTYFMESDPYIGYMRSRYTAEELKEIDEYAASLHMEVIPCIQTLAHLKNVIKWNQYPKDDSEILLVGDEDTYALIDRMLGFFKGIFKSDKIHVGMDEAHGLGRGTYMDKNGYREKSAIIKEHLEKVNALCKQHGYKPMIWSDMFFRSWNNGKYAIPRCEMPKEITENYPKDVIPVYWDYYHHEERIYDVHFDAHKQMSKNTWFAGGAWSWGGFMPHNGYGMLTMKPGIRSAIKNKVKNAFITMWGDDGAECSKVAMLPSLFAISEFAKGNEDMNLIKEKFKKSFGISFDEFMLLDALNDINGTSVDYKSPVNPSKYMLFSDYFNGFLDVTVVGGEGEKYRELVPKLLEVAKKSHKFGYLFKTAAALADALTVKFELGYKTRMAYKAGDKDELRRLAENDYKEAEKLIRRYHKVFEEQWFYENKSCGFDVQDIRLGATLQRTVSCRKRLLDYVNGKVDSIPELDEELIPYRGFEKRSIYCNDAKYYLTTNSLAFLT